MGKISVQQLFDMNTALKERVGKRLSKIVSTDSLKGLGQENNQVGSLKSSTATQRTYADVLVGRKWLTRVIDKKKRNRITRVIDKRKKTNSERMRLISFFRNNPFPYDKY